MENVRSDIPSQVRVQRTARDPPEAVRKERYASYPLQTTPGSPRHVNQRQGNPPAVSVRRRTIHSRLSTVRAVDHGRSEGVNGPLKSPPVGGFHTNRFDDTLELRSLFPLAVSKMCGALDRQMIHATRTSRAVSR